VTAPFIRTEPEEDWVKASELGVIPPAVFALYKRAGFLSFGSSPQFLSDEKHYLFGYFAMILESIRGTLTDADQALQTFITAQAKVFDLGKERRGEEWEDSADGHAKNQFRILVLSLCSSLDATAEITALLLTNQIPGLRVGRADFQKIEDWLKRPLPKARGVIVTPHRGKLEALHKNLRPIVEAAGPEKEWLPLMKLFRHKAAHLGTVHFREIGFADKNDRFHRFFPRHWPVLWEEHMSTRSSGAPGEPKTNIATMQDQFMRQDNISYVKGLRAKITTLIESAFEVLDSTYWDFRDFHPNQEALLQLQKNVQTFAFEGFPEPN
jgi:hypothetical protein